MLPYILVVEDNQDLHEYIRTLLTDNQYVVKIVSDGASAVRAIAKTEPDLILLDLTLPDVDGGSLCKELHEKYPEISIIILTAKDGVTDKVSLLSWGADDYITKPFSGPELIARIRTRLRHREPDDPILKIGDLVMDTKKITVTRGGASVRLTAHEFKLLEYLMQNKNIVLSRDMILNRIWQYAPDVESRVVDVYIGYLRKKIDSGHGRKLIQAVRGFGYTIRD